MLNKFPLEEPSSARTRKCGINGYDSPHSVDSTDAYLPRVVAAGLITEFHILDAAGPSPGFVMQLHILDAVDTPLIMIRSERWREAD
jgi:hypothetical protein